MQSSGAQRLDTGQQDIRPQRFTLALPAPQGAFWVMLALGGPRVVGAAATIILRRLLGPGLSGLFDLAMTPYTFLDGLRTIGTGPALIYEQRIDIDMADTAWTVNMLVAVIVAIAAQFLAHPIAVYYGHPAVANLLRVLAIAYVLTSLGSVHYFLLLRRMDFRGRSIPAMGQVIAASSVAVLLAVWGFGVGALIWREIVSAAVGAVLLWAVYPYRPHVRLMLPLARRLLGYGIWVSAGMTLLFISQNVDIFIGGHVIHAASEIGFYTTSWNIAFLAAGLMMVAATTMVFPALSRLQHDPEAFQETLLRTIRQAGLVVYPTALLLAVTAPVLIVPLLGVKFAPYRDSFAVLSLLSVYAGNRTMLSIFLEGYKAIGRPRLLWAYNLVKLLVLIPAMLIGAQHGIMGLAAAYVPIQVIEIPAALALAWAVLGTSPGAVMRALSTPLFAGLLMTAAVIVLEAGALGLLHLGDVVTLALCLVAGASVYVAAVLILDRTLLGETVRVMTHGL